MDAFLNLLMLVLVCALVALIGLFIFWAADSVGTQTRTESATVIERTFTPAHSTTTMVMSGNVMVPIITYHPDSWSLTVELANGATTSCTVSEDQYNANASGAVVKAIVKSGRISGGTYCDGIN